MISMCVIPNLAKMPTLELVKCIVLSVSLDAVLILASINL